MISVIIPVYKVEKYLRYCLDSLKAQTYTDFEAIMVDDGSPDGSGDICEEYAAADSRFCVIHQENKGLSGARNTGLAKAQGEYVTLLDSDDVIHPGYLQHLYNCAASGDAQMAICRYIRIPEVRMPEGQYFLQNTEYPLPKNLQWESRTDSAAYCSGREAVKMIEVNGFRYAIIAVAKLYHRSLLPFLIYPEGKFHEDEFVTYRVFYNCRRVAVSGKAFYGYVQRKGSITSRYNLRRLDAVDALEGAVRYFDDAGDAELALAARKRLLLYLQAVWYHIFYSYKERTDLLNSVKQQRKQLLHRHGAEILSICTFTDRVSIRIFGISPGLYCRLANIYMQLAHED